MMTAPHQTEVALIKLVIVIIQIVHRDHTLTVVLIDLGIDTIRGDAADMRIELLTDLISHELHHLIFDAVALCLLCYLLHLAAVLAEFLVMITVGRAPTILITGEQTVHHRIGITADRTGEMGVVVEGQSVVTDIKHAVLRLHHRAQRYVLHHILLPTTIKVVHQLIQVLADLLLRTGGLQLIPEVHHKLAQTLQLLWVGLVVDTVRQRLGLLSLLYLSDRFSHLTVSQQHKLLDQLVGILRFLIVSTDGLALLIHIEMQFFTIELHRAVLKALLAQFLG